MSNRQRPTRRGEGILAGPVDARERVAQQYPVCEATPGLRVVHRASGFAGDVVELAGDALVLRGATGLDRRFRNEPGAFSVDAMPVRLVAPSEPNEVDRPAHLTSARVSAQRTASGSRAVVGAK